MAGSPKQRRRMTALVRQWEASSESRRTFAQRHGLTVSQFDYWKRQARRASPTDAVSFAPVRVLGAVESGAGDGVEVVLTSGARVVVHAGASVDLLRTVFTALALC
jgi:hypothetical protein